MYLNSSVWCNDVKVEGLYLHSTVIRNVSEQFCMVQLCRSRGVVATQYGKKECIQTVLHGANMSK